MERCRLVDVRPGQEVSDVCVGEHLVLTGGGAGQGLVQCLLEHRHLPLDGDLLESVLSQGP